MRADCTMSAKRIGGGAGNQSTAEENIGDGSYFGGMAGENGGFGEIYWISISIHKEDTGNCLEGVYFEREGNLSWKRGEASRRGRAR